MLPNVIKSLLILVNFQLVVQATRINIALGKKAYQQPSYSATSFLAEKAVDGDTGFYNDNYCVLGKDKTASWLVIDLDGFYQVGEVEIISSHYYEESLKNVIVGLSSIYEPGSTPNQNSYYVCGQYEGKPLARRNITMQCPLNFPPQRFIIIQQPTNGIGFIALCEVMVYKRTEKNLTHFVDCFETFEDTMEFHNISINHCAARCRRKNKTFFSAKEGACLCGSHPSNSGMCTETNLKVFSVCPPGLYGARCSKMCQCKDNLPCEVRNGSCPNECSKFWSGLDCNLANYTASDTSVGCVKQQKFSVIALDSLENCKSTCKQRGYNFAGWRPSNCWCNNGPLALQEQCGENDLLDIYSSCPTGTFGYNCSLVCNCKNNGSCSYMNGICSEGCMDGWIGPSCNQRDCSVNNGHCTPDSNCVTESSRSLCVCRSSYTRPTIGSVCTRQNSFFGVAIAVGILIGILILAVIAALIYFLRESVKGLCNNKVKEQKSKSIYYSRQISTDDLIISSPSSLPVGINLKLVNYPDYVAANSQSFAEEFQSLPIQTSSTCTYGLQKQIKSKNRFKNIIPYDNNRVILKQLPGSEFSDYINASYITGYEAPILIATQAPIPPTIHDFWRMVGEQEVGLIVMLCNVEENDKIRCSIYWPESADASYGGYKIKFQSAISWSGFCQRNFTLETPKSVERQVVQLHFSEWPDHGVPDDILNFLYFRKHFRMLLSARPCPSIIHCSAGVGRTGCFLAVDYLMEKAAKDEYLDVPECVRIMRKERPRMVQTQVQYEFIYNCLVVKEIMGDTVYRPQEYLEHFQRILDTPQIQNCLMNQFELVLQSGQRQSGKVPNCRTDKSCVNIKNIFGDMEIRVISTATPAVILEELLSGCNNFIAFDPNQKLLAVLNNSRQFLNKKESLSLKEAVAAEFGTQLFVRRVQSPQHKDLETSHHHQQNKSIYENVVCGQSSEIVVNIFEEPHGDKETYFRRMSFLFKDVVQGVLKYEETLRVFNLSESDSAGVFMAFSWILETMALRNEISIYEPVVELNRQSQTLLVKTFNSYQDLYYYVLQHLLMKNKNT